MLTKATFIFIFGKYDILLPGLLAKSRLSAVSPENATFNYLITFAVSKLFNTLRIIHNSTQLMLPQAHLMQLIKGFSRYTSVLELEHTKYLPW